jgi:hypothetical protein
MSVPWAALQRHNTENSKHIFPEKELRGLSPGFHIHVSMSDLYIPRIGLLILLQENMDRSWEYINRSQTHKYGNLDYGRAIRFLGIQNINEIFVAVWGFLVAPVGDPGVRYCLKVRYLRLQNFICAYSTDF